MNAILLGAASLGALAAIFTGDPSNTAAAKAAFQETKAAQLSEDIGSMTHTSLVDTRTGERTEISVISFID